MKADVHMHTCFSHDSKSSPEEMIKGCIVKGLETVCFTDHYDKDYVEWGIESVFDVKEYFAALLPLKEKYEQKIKIRIGVELGLQPHLGEIFEQLTKEYPFDFVIGSVHSVNHGQDPAFGAIFEGRTDEEVYRMIFQEMLQDIKKVPSFDVLGHIDYMTRYGKEGIEKYSYQKYAEEIDEILKEIITQGKGIELNMAGLKYQLPFAHPHPDILKRYRELGGEIITVGSDAHQPEHIAYAFQKADEILKGCGFTYYTEFENRKPIFKQLV